ncbi:MAG: hypothetical protein EA401_03925 [Planctomycetota bacterium]|nr:MAG: hypothetical protein EA401_03925 [Planctomycetota bacterium]
MHHNPAFCKRLPQGSTAHRVYRSLKKNIIPINSLACQSQLLYATITGAVGRRVEVLLRPDDVVLGLPPLHDALSLSNRLEGSITNITRSPERCLVQVDVGAERPLLAELVGSAVTRLGLRVRQRVIVLTKAQATQAIGL